MSTLTIEQETAYSDLEAERIVAINDDLLDFFIADTEQTGCRVLTESDLDTIVRAALSEENQTA